MDAPLDVHAWLLACEVSNHRDALPEICDRGQSDPRRLTRDGEVWWRHQEALEPRRVVSQLRSVPPHAVGEVERGARLLVPLDLAGDALAQA